MLSKEGAYSRTSGHIYLAVVQSVLIYGSEMWVMTPRIGRGLGRLYHRVAHRLTWRQPWRGQDGVCVYLPLEDSMVEVRLRGAKTYVSCRQNTVTQFIATRPIMDLCLAAEWMPGSRVAKQWWEQDGLDLEGMWTAAWEAERTEGGEETDGTDTETD